MPTRGSQLLLSDHTRAFVQVAETRSFRGAAQSLKLGQSTVSRHIVELERMLGVRLLQRSTRAVVVTEAGRLFLDRCRLAMETVEQAERELHHLASRPAGELIVHVPVSFGRLHLAPIMHEFMRLYPELGVEVVLSDDFVDFADHRVDVAIRIGRLDHGNLIARRLADNVRQLCASPEYLKHRGAPDHPHQLVNHDLLEFTPLRTAGTWQFTGPSQDQLVIKVDSLLRSNNAEFLAAAALNGVGIVPLARFIVAGALRAGTLVEVMPEWRIPGSPIHVVYPDRVQLPPKTRSFVDFMVERFKTGCPWEK
jgi:DNA-binding transcriptional LysR family regulator